MRRDRIIVLGGGGSGSSSGVTVLGSFTSPVTTNPLTLAPSEAYNVILFYGATGEVDLPPGQSGMNVIIYNTGAFTITVDPDGSEVLVRDGTAQTGGVSCTLSSGAGNFVSWVYTGSEWVSLGSKGVLAEGS